MISARDVAYNASPELVKELSGYFQLDLRSEDNVLPVLNIVEHHLRDALKRKRENKGLEAAQNSVNEIARSSYASQEQMYDLFGDNGVTMIRAEIERAFMRPNMSFSGSLPWAVSFAMKVLATGQAKTDPKAPNEVLNQFLGAGPDSVFLYEVYEEVHLRRGSLG